MKKRIEVIFSQEDNSIDPDQLSKFLLLFGSVYRASAEILNGVSEREFLINQNLYIQEIKDFLREGDQSDVCQVSKYISNYEIVGISYNSPLSIFTRGTIVALVAAVIISGGKAEVWGANFELNSLGSGIEQIISAFKQLEDDPAVAVPPSEADMGVSIETSDKKDDNNERPAT
ncbi:hypothetical protein JFR02_002849 [Vibrio harveyi]|nr:hypothetical protein [Vibrio harveyi]